MTMLPRTNLGLFLLSVPIVLVAAFVVFYLIGEDAAGHLADLENPAFATLATVLAFGLYWTTRKTPSKELDIRLVVVFMLLALGEITWSVYTELLEQEVGVSLADAFWLLGYFALIFLLVQVVRGTKLSISKDLAFVQVAFWLLVSPVLVYVVKTSLESTDLSSLEILTWNVYTFLDATILSMLVMLLWSFRKGLLEDCWTFVVVSIAFMMVGDLLFTVYDAAGRYTAGSIPDVFYVGSYVLLSVGFGLMIISRSRQTPVSIQRTPFDQIDETRLLVPRMTYVIEGGESRRAYDLMVKGLTAGLDGMVITNKPPAMIRPTLGLGKTKVYQLSGSEGDNVVNPKDQEALAKLVESFMEQGPKTVVLLDGFETMVASMQFKTALATLDRLKDVVSDTGSRLIVPVDKRALSEKEIALIEKSSVVLT